MSNPFRGRVPEGDNKKKTLFSPDVEFLSHIWHIFENKRSLEIKLLELNQALIKYGFDKIKSDEANKQHQEWDNLCEQEETLWR